MNPFLASMSVRPLVYSPASSSSTYVSSNASCAKIPSYQDFKYPDRSSFLSNSDSSASSKTSLSSGIVASVLPLSIVSFLCASYCCIRT